MDTKQFETLPGPGEPTQPTGIARRRLLRAGLAAGPVALTLTGRSAMAAGCLPGLSPAAWNSLTHNGTQACTLTSHTVNLNALGVSPGNWKPNGGGRTLPATVFNVAWPATVVVPYSGYVTGAQPTAKPDWQSGTLFGAVFSSPTQYKDISFSLIFLTYPNSVESHLCAAYLNAKTYPSYALTVTEVIDLAGGKLGGRSGLNVAEIKTFLAQTWS
jgi:hypothetical protein